MSSTSLRRSAVQLFHPKFHMWVRLPPNKKAVIRNECIPVELGLTQRGWENIGNVQNFRPLVPVPSKDVVHIGQNLLELEWEGHAITSADELYHTVWESFSETTILPSPLQGVLIETEDPSKVYEDEETVLGILHTTFENLEEAIKNVLVHQSEYERFLEQTPPGRFAEPVVED